MPRNEGRLEAKKAKNSPPPVVDNKESISEKNKQYRVNNPEHCKKLRDAQYIKHQDRNINDQKNLRDE